METFEDLRSEIEALPHREYMKLAHWFAECDWDTWDKEIERDGAAGNLDFLIDEALEEKGKGELDKL
jgi:hypothetical protein